MAVHHRRVVVGGLDRDRAAFGTGIIGIVVVGIMIAVTLDAGDRRRLLRRLRLRKRRPPE